jgi:hypothetical protein
MYRTSAALLLPLLLLLASCGHNDKNPDLSGITVPEIQIERFDTAFFNLDSNHIQQGLYRLDQAYPDFTGDFVSNILGAGPLSDTSTLAFEATREFLVSYLSISDSLKKKYQRFDWLEKELQQGFRYVKHYFPLYPLPQKVVTFIGPLDGPGVALTTHDLAIGLQAYAGKNFYFYQTGKGQDMYPGYISRRFEPEYMEANCLSAMEEDIFPDSSDGRPLIEEMVIKGRYWWLAEKLMPDAPDSIITGYMPAQLNWCGAHEGDIWGYLLQQNVLYTIDPDILKNYIGEGPYTLGMPNSSPGNIGAWVGRQIVRKYVEGHPGIQPVDLMRVPAQKLFEESRYKPR